MLVASIVLSAHRFCLHSLWPEVGGVGGSITYNVVNGIQCCLWPALNTILPTL